MTGGSERRDGAIAARLLATFADELQDVVQDGRRRIARTLSQPSALTQTLTELLRNVHRLKGAAHAVRQEPLVDVCHQLERLLQGWQQRDTPVVDTEWQFVDGLLHALLSTGQRLQRGEPLDAQRLAGWSREVAARCLADPSALATPGAASDGEQDDAAALRRRDAAHRLSDDSSAIDGPPVLAGGSLRVRREQLEQLAERAGELADQRRRAVRLELELQRLLSCVGLPAAWSGSRREVQADDQPAGRRGPRSLAGSSSSLPSIRQLALSLSEERVALDRLVRGLDDAVRQLHLSNLDEVCLGFERLVQQAAGACQKSVRLSVLRSSLEFDRGHASLLRDSLVQLVRNAIDHGLETPAERRAAGKPLWGRIEIAAGLDGDQLVFRVQDDGRGLDLSRIRDALVGESPGLATATESELLQAVFRHGFSTAGTACQLSGRGVGLDLVKDLIERADGSVRLRHVAGTGASFELRLPARQFGVRVVLCEVDGRQLAVPEPYVGEILAIANGRPVRELGQLLAGGRDEPAAGPGRSGPRAANPAARPGRVLRLSDGHREVLLGVDRVLDIRPALIERQAGAGDDSEYLGTTRSGDCPLTWVINVPPLLRREARRLEIR